MPRCGSSGTLDRNWRRFRVFPSVMNDAGASFRTASAVGTPDADHTEAGEDDSSNNAAMDGIIVRRSGIRCGRGMFNAMRCNAKFGVHAVCIRSVERPKLVVPNCGVVPSLPRVTGPDGFDFNRPVLGCCCVALNYVPLRA